MIRFLVALLAAAVMLPSVLAQAVPGMTKPEFEKAKDGIKTTFEGERRACSRLAANTRETCVDRLRGEERIALAQLQLNYTGTADDEFALYQAQYEARYDVDRQRCAELAGKDKDICIQQAKTERDKAKADARMARRINEAVAEDTRARMKADYELAREKCDVLSGDARGVCIDTAKARLKEGW